jgi:glycosyltransferase involved in cell wall biosynthesis
MNVILATYQSIGLLQGGPRTQILQTQRSLEQQGVSVRLFSAWEGFGRESTDLVHLFGAHIGTYHLAREFHKLGVPMAVTPIWYSRHTPLVIRGWLSMGRLFRRPARGLWTDYGMLAEICSWARIVLPNTAAEADLLVRGLGVAREKICVVPNGVEERFATADPSLFVRTYGVRDFVLNVGHIGPGRKNVLRLVRALEKINAPAVIMGRIETNPYGEACLAEAKLNPRIVVLDALPNDSPMLASAYEACQVFALPSLFETPGIAALEAGMAGANIVITPHGGTKEYFGDQAEYVEPTSYELIRNGIVKALNKGKTSYLREHLRGHYLWERVGERTLSAYRRVL